MNNEPQKKHFPSREKLLLHACCAPCSSHCLELLSKDFDIDILYYNPNITAPEEYKKRVDELFRFVSEAPFAMGVTVIPGRYDPAEFYEIAAGLEDAPERGPRCYKCYELRMRETALYAKNNNYDIFTTTLSISPHKNAAWINEIGQRLSEECGVSYLYSDFKKKDGYKRSIELSKEYNLYRQNFCGCEYSRQDNPA